MKKLEKESNVQKVHFPNLDKTVTLYNLDVIISVRDRFKSQNNVIFRKRVNNIPKNIWFKALTEFEKYRLKQDKLYQSDFDQLLLESENND